MGNFGVVKVSNIIKDVIFDIHITLLCNNFFIPSEMSQNF